MVLSEKEKNIVWIIGVGAGALVLFLGWDWWSGQRRTLDVAHDKLVAQQKDNDTALERGKHAEADFAALKVQVLDPAKLDQAATDKLVYQMFSSGGLTFTNWAGTAARAIPSHADFMEAKYTGTATTTTARLARFLQYIETAKLPAKIDEITITTPKSGIDNLRVDFKISALLYLPPKQTTTRSGTTTPASRSSTSPGGTRPGTATRGGTRPATAPQLSSEAELERKAAEMARRREEENARLATMPEPPPPGPPRSEEEILKELEARRAAEDKAVTTQTSTQPDAPRPAPNNGGTP